MSSRRDHNWDVEPTDSASFEDALTELLQQARENGVQIEGGWEPTTETDRSELWDVVITPVERDGSTTFV